MAETTKILAPKRTVLFPVLEAGCSLAETVTADDVLGLRKEHPDGLVVSYINTSAAVKAESDICFTSTNAVEVVLSLPEDQEVLFIPDFFLGNHVRRVTRRRLELWMGECHVHAKISPVQLRKKLAAEPDSRLLVHPEFGCTAAALTFLDDGEISPERGHILSTGSALIATETVILHQLRKASPLGDFRAEDEEASCEFMKIITPESLLRSLRERNYEIHVPEDARQRSSAAVERMVGIGPSPAASRWVRHQVAILPSQKLIRVVLSFLPALS